MYINQINLIGTDYINYVISISGYSNASIAPAYLTANFYSLGKVYDRNNYAPVSYNLSGFFPFDIGSLDISNTWIATYENNQVGFNILIDISNIQIYGSSSTNYYITSISTISGIISQKYIYSTGIDKIYDNNTIAQLTISGIIDDDQIFTTSYFDTIYVGNNKLITISGLITGEQYNNYQLYNNTTTANIYPKSLYAYFSGGSKIYDYTQFTTNLVDISYVFVGLFNNDDVTISNIIGTFKDKTAGPEIIDVSNIILTGPQAFNYYIIDPPPFMSYIYQYGITATFTTIPKIYDYNYNATNYTFGTLSGIFGLDAVSISSFIATFRNFTVGNEIIDISNIILTSNEAINYYVLPILSIEGEILQKALQPVFSKGTKIYDGTYLEFNLLATLSGILGLDTVGVNSYTTIFESNQSGYQLIDVSNFIIDGIDSFNYYIPPIQAFMGYITPKDLIISYINSQQAYTGRHYTNFNVSYNGLVSIDNPTSLSGILGYAISTDNTYNSKNNIINNQVNWIMVGSGIGANAISYSINGINWFNSNIIFNNYGSSVTTNNVLWVAVGSGVNTIAYSYNGINWTGLGNSIFSQIGLCVIYSDNRWYATGQGTYTLAYSDDGINWYPMGINIFTNYARGISANKYIIVAVGQGNNTIAYSLDSIIWTGLGNDIFDIKGISIVNNNIMWVALGKGTINNMAYSYDGIIWHGLGLNIFSDGGNYAIWDGSKFIAVGYGINTIAYSYDGINWVGLGNTLLTIGLNIVYNGLVYYATGTTNNAISNDGINWNIYNFNSNISIIYSIQARKSIQFLYDDQIIDSGTYNIVPGGLYDTNYYITYNAGTTNINKAKLQITHNNYHKIYDSNEFNNFGVTYTGFMNADTSMNLTGDLIYYSDTDLVNVGKYFITPSGLVAINYDITFNSGELDIIKAPLVIRANNNIKIYDIQPYQPSYTVYGLLNNDSLNDFSGTIIFYGNYNNYNVGFYDIFTTGLTSNNYDIKYIKGILQIVKAPLFIIANNDNQIYYNDISDYLLIYNPLNYILLLNNSIQAINDIFRQERIWSLNGYEGSCILSFSPPDYLCSIGLTEVNFNYQGPPSGYNQYMVNTNSDINGYYLTITEGDQTYNFDYIIPNDPNTLVQIKYQNSTITYYLNNNVLRTVSRPFKRKLYINLFTYYANQIISNIYFNSIQDYYYGGNGFYCDGFTETDSIADLSGSIIYSGTSQGATETGKYTIIPSGFTSANYNITFVNGYLQIKRSIQN